MKVGRTLQSGLRLFAGLGRGPVQGYAGDDGMFYLAVGAAYPFSERYVIQAEGRAGMLGESGYSQIAIGFGIRSLPR